MLALGFKIGVHFTAPSPSRCRSACPSVGQTRNLHWPNTKPPLTKHEIAARNTVSPGPSQQSAPTPPNWSRLCSPSSVTPPWRHVRPAQEPLTYAPVPSNSGLIQFVMTYFIYVIFVIITYQDRYRGGRPAEGENLEKTMTRFLRVRNEMITRSVLMLLMFVTALINFSAHAQTNTWINSPFASQSGNFSVTFNATPNANDADIVIGLSQAPASAYTNLAAVVRFNNTGSIDVRNGGAYSSAVTVAYSAGTTYSFRMVVSIPSHTYSVYVTPPGMSAILLASNYAFRTEQASVGSLANVGELGTAGTASITNFLVTPSTIRMCTR